MPAVALPTGVSLFYDERGSGEPVLLIMGTGADHTLWDATAKVFAERHRVTAQCELNAPAKRIFLGKQLPSGRSSRVLPRPTMR